MSKWLTLGLIGFYYFSSVAWARSGHLQTLLGNTAALESCKTLTQMGLTTGIVNYWKLSGTGSIANGATISASSGVSGTVTNTDGSGMSYVAGPVDQGIKFGGDDFINFGSGTANSVVTAYTVSLWVKPGSGTSGGLFFRGNSADCYYNPSIVLNSTTRALTVNESGCGGTGSMGSTTIPNAWTHVAVTRSGATAKVYINGVLTITDTSQPAPGGSSGLGRVIVGGSWHSSTSVYTPFTDASLDEVIMYSVALSDTDIQTLYNGQNCF